MAFWHRAQSDMCFFSAAYSRINSLFHCWKDKSWFKIVTQIFTSIVSALDRHLLVFSEPRLGMLMIGYPSLRFIGQLASHQLRAFWNSLNNVDSRMVKTKTVRFVPCKGLDQWSVSDNLGIIHQWITEKTGRGVRRSWETFFILTPC